MTSIRDVFRQPAGRAAVPVLAASVVCLSVLLAGVRTLDPRTLYYGAIGVVLVSLTVGLVVRSSVAMEAAVAVVAVTQLAITIFCRTGELFSGRTGLPDTSEAPIATAGLLILGTGILVTGKRAGPDRKRPNIGRLVRRGIASAVTLVLATLGVLSALSEVRAVNLSSGTRTLLTDLVEGPGREPVREYTLVAKERVIQGEWYWTYNGTVPGPEIRAAVGDRLRITLVNHLPEATSIHWHGVAVPNAEDGVAGLTQDAVPSGGSYTYEFVVRGAGTLWYHSHQNTFHQLLRGLYGALVVLPRGGISADRDHVLFVHEFFGGSRDVREDLGGLITGAPSGQVPAINGVTGELRLEADPGERVRLRVIAAMQGDTFVRDIPQMMRAAPQELVLLGAPYEIVALDGADINGPTELGPTRMRIGIGQRYDLEFTMPASGSSVRLVDLTGNESVTIGDGSPPEVPNLSDLPLFDLLSYGTPAPSPVDGAHFDLTYRMLLGEHFGFHDGQLQLVHTINSASSPEGTDYPVAIGGSVRFLIENRTEEFHSMHMHGQSFWVLSRDGLPITGSPIQLDTLLVAPLEDWEIAFVPDNPGLWMFHCHVLIHASFGMAAMVSYPGIETPFDVGELSGNRPE